MEWSRRVVVGLVIIVNGLQGVHPLDPCSLTKFDVTEGTETGTVIRSFNYSDSITVTITDQYGFFRIENKSFVVNKTIIVDGNPSLCGTNGIYSIYLTCSDGNSNPSPTQIFVSIQLVQNHAPTFSQANYTYYVTEEQSGEIDQFGKFLETDDCSPNPSWQIGFHENTTKFEISGNDLLKYRKLDYDSGDKDFTFQIWGKIINTNYPAKANATVHVIVQDVDDMDPTFNRSSYTIAVQENDTTIINQWRPASPPIDAYDRDTGLSPPDPLIFDLPDKPDFLTINETTGQLMFTRVLDREERDVYNFTVKVRQTNAALRTATATLTVVVTDVNDNRPQFKVADVTATIPEHLAANIAVTQVSATDADQGANAEFTYFLVNGTDYLAVDAVSGVLTVSNASALDREAVSDIVVVVGTRERRPPYMNDTCEGPNCTCIVRLHLTDVNDNSPQFDKASYEFHVSSGAAGTPVGTVTATDRDEGDNAVLTYEVEATSHLAVNSSTGHVTLGSSLPSPGSYDASLRACDSPLPPQQPRCASVLVRVVFGANITIDTSPINASVRENLPPKTYVTSLKGPMTYEINDGNFSIQNNALVTQVVLDREATPSFHLRVDVMINNQVNHSFDVFIAVEDENDNAPQFSPPDYTVFLPEGAQKDVVIATVTATDPDEGANGAVHYKIQGSMGNSNFRINSSSGEITLKHLPELSPGELYREVLVAAVDGGTPLLMSTASVKVFVGSDNYTIKIPTPVERETILKDKGFLASELSRILNVSVTLANVTSVASGFDTKSLIHISARYENQTAVGAQVLNTLVFGNWDAVKELFERYRSSEAPAVSSGGMSPHVIALIVIAVVTFIVATTTIAVICRKYEKLQKQNQLYAHMSRDISIYAGHGTLQMEDEVSKAGSLSRPLVDSDRHSQHNGHVMGFVNRGFQQEDGGTELKTPSSAGVPNGHVTTVQAEVQESPRELPDDSGNVTPHSGSLTSDPDSGEQDLGQDDLDPIARDISPSVQANNVFDSEPAGGEVASLEAAMAAPPGPDYAARWDEEGGQAAPGSQVGEEEGEGAQSPPTPPGAASPSIGGRMRTVSVDDLPPPPPPLHDDLDDDDDDDDDDESEAAHSKFAFRRPTPPVLPPPPAFASGQPETGSQPPEEPDPDYKHVRFSDAVVAHGDEASTSGDVTSVGNDVISAKRGRRSPPLPSLSANSDEDEDEDVGGGGGATEVTQAVVEINSPSDALLDPEDDVIMFNFSSLDDEITQF